MQTLSLFFCQPIKLKWFIVYFMMYAYQQNKWFSRDCKCGRSASMLVRRYIIHY